MALHTKLSLPKNMVPRGSMKSSSMPPAGQVPAAEIFTTAACSMLRNGASRGGGSTWLHADPQRASNMVRWRTAIAALSRQTQAIKKLSKKTVRQPHDSRPVGWQSWQRPVSSTPVMISHLQSGLRGMRTETLEAIPSAFRLAGPVFSAPGPRSRFYPLTLRGFGRKQ